MCVSVCARERFLLHAPSVFAEEKGHVHTFCDVFMCLLDKKKSMTAVSVHVCQFLFHL